MRDDAPHKGLTETVWTSEEVVRVFTEFFEANDHLRIPGAPLVPKNDPTLLFINSGMAPLKNYFLGLETPPHPDLVNVQGCIRTTDIEDVGDRHHLTYFEMLGSWSIGRYWKDKAIELAFELLTRGFGFPVERLYATVYAGDEELGVPPDEDSIRWWQEVGLPADQIVRLGADNFWGPAGQFGPCGPCTEVFFDTGEQFGPKYEPGGHFDDKGRYIEIWNAGVFMQYDLQPDGLKPLEIQSVDTGSGVERMVMTLNGLDSVYDTDILKPIAEAARSQMGAVEEGVAELIADHVRSAAFILAEDVPPSNTGAGYVLRRLIRRAVATVVTRGVEGFDFGAVLDQVFSTCPSWNGHLLENEASVREAFLKEEEAFQRVIVRGLERLESLTEGDQPHISGEDAFRLFATYGLPIDTLREHVRSKGGSVDEEGFARAYEEHQELSRGRQDSDVPSVEDYAVKIPATEFTGYTATDGAGTVQLLVGPDGELATAEAGDRVQVVLDQSPFYGEAGGQVGDVGTIDGPDGVIEVTDTKKDGAGHVVHHGVVREGSVSRGDEVTLTVDSSYRRGLTQHHSATHLLNAALRDVLGGHVEQAGSKVETDRLRFDFRHDGKMSEAELREVERIMNRYIRDNYATETRVMPYQEALDAGAVAVFDEKYGDDVRVVRFGDASMELCGGTHVSATGDIGLCLITTEGSVSAGVRRISAVAGATALERIQMQAEQLSGVARRLGSPIDQVLPALDARLAAGAAKTSSDGAEAPKLTELSGDVKTLDDGTPYLAAELGLKAAALREAALGYAEQLGGIVMLLGPEGEKVRFVVTVAREKTDRYDAGRIMGRIAPTLAGRGGGKSHLAQGGGDNPAGIAQAIEEFAGVLAEG